MILFIYLKKILQVGLGIESNFTIQFNFDSQVCD